MLAEVAPQSPLFAWLSAMKKFFAAEFSPARVQNHRARFTVSGSAAGVLFQALSKQGVVLQAAADCAGRIDRVTWCSLRKLRPSKGLQRSTETGRCFTKIVKRAAVRWGRPSSQAACCYQRAEAHHVPDSVQRTTVAPCSARSVRNTSLGKVAQQVPFADPAAAQQPVDTGASARDPCAGTETTAFGPGNVLKFPSMRCWTIS